MANLLLFWTASVALGYLTCLAMHPVRLYLRLRRIRVFRERQRKVIPITRHRQTRIRVDR